jgi:hypothetical protein
MNKVSIKEAFERENLDVNAVSVSGIPERHIDAVLAFAKLIVGADHVDGDGELDFTDYNQLKYAAFATMGSPSGAGFAYGGYDPWHTHSGVGSRLSFKSREAAKYLFDENPELYKAMMVYSRNLKFLNDK